MSGMNNASQEPKLCSNGCGFFGSGDHGLCSKCHNESIRSQQQAAVAAPVDSSVSGAQIHASYVSPTASIAEIAPQSPMRRRGLSIAKGLVEGQENPQTAESLVEGLKGLTVAQDQQKKPEEDDSKVQKNKNRCWTCNKKTGLLGFECSCGYVFCGKHRHPEEHKCDFDWQQKHRAILEKQNQKCVAAKLERID